MYCGMVSSGSAVIGTQRSADALGEDTASLELALPALAEGLRSFLAVHRELQPVLDATLTTAGMLMAWATIERLAPSNSD